MNLKETLDKGFNDMVEYFKGFNEVGIDIGNYKKTRKVFK